MIGVLVATAAFAMPLADGPLVLEATEVTRARAPVVGWIDVTTVSVARLEIEASDSGYRARQQLCSVELDNRPNLGATVIPDAFIASVPEAVFPVRLFEGEGGTRFYADPGPTWVGVSPVEGSLPAEAGADAVVDFEDDGQPGATVHVKVPFVGTVEMYIAQVYHHRFEGVVEDGRVEGSIELVRMEQRTLGSSHPRLAADMEREWVPEQSRFVVRPMRPGECGSTPREG